MRTLLKVLMGGLLTLPLMAHAAEKKKEAPAPAKKEAVVVKKETPAPAPAKSKVPTLGEVLESSGITLTGAIDASYDWSDVDGGPGTTTHAFDLTQNSFNLHQVNVNVAKAAKDGFGFGVNAIYGDDALVIDGNELAVPAAYIAYNTGNLTITGGRFLTLAGSEVINPAGNLNASRGLLFWMLQPLFHNGVRATYAFGSMASITAGYLNSVFPAASTGFDNNTNKTLELQLAFTPSSMFGVYLTGYSGDEDPQTGGFNGTLRRDVGDVVVNVNLDMLTLGLNGTYVSTECTATCFAAVPAGAAIQQGLAGYVQAKFGKMRVAVRSEYVDLDSDTTGSPSNGLDRSSWLRENTVTFGYAAADNFELMVEGRNDVVDAGETGGFAIRNPLSGTDEGNNDQWTATVKGVYKF